jgi:hypothetical protein
VKDKSKKEQAARMTLSTEKRRHFIVKHGLDAFETLPNYIWRTSKGEDEVPHRFKQVRLGDRWVGFAYTTSDNRERPLSRVTGFFECVSEARYDDLPPPAAGRPVSEGKTRGWLIEGRECGDQPREPVGVKPISDILGRRLWANQGIVPINANDFDKIRQHTLSRQFDTKTIPLLGREPENEQEVLAAVVFGHKQIGIEKIIRVRKAFPDLLVQFHGSEEEVHIELEVYSEGFFSHGHHLHVSERRFVRDGRRVAVLCWIDNKKDVINHVCRVYELQSLIREGKKMDWFADPQCPGTLISTP